MSSILGTHDLDIFSATGGPEVATFGNQNAGVQIRFYDQYSQNGAGGYLAGMNNSNFWIIKDAGSNAQVGIGTTLPTPGATLQVQGTLFTSNIGTYNSNSNIYFNNQNVMGVSNIVFNGNLINANTATSFVTSQWNTTTNNDIQFAGNVAIGATNITSFGTACNLLVVGNMLITGNVTASNYVNQNAVLGVYSSATIYNPAGDGSKTILTNDPTTANCVLYSFNLGPGRYIITSTIPYQNLTPMMALDTANWGTVGLYQATPQTLTTTTVPIRYSQLSAIGSYISTDLEAISFSWFLDSSTINQPSYVIAVFGKGHQLKFAPSGYNFPAPTLYTVPMRGIGYDDIISVRQALQINPVRSTQVLTGYKTAFPVAGNGYLTAATSNVDFYVNGSKLNSLSDYTLSTAAFDGTTTSWTINTTTAIATNSKVDILLWPQVNPANSSFYSSGFLYQQINTSSSPWLNVASGGVRLGSKCVIDGDLYVQGNIWGGCNTNAFTSTLQYTGNAPFNIAANTIGTGNLINGAVTPAKMNFLNSGVTLNTVGTNFIMGTSTIIGSIGIGTTSLNSTYTMECYGLAHIGGGLYVDNFIQTQNIVSPTLFQVKSGANSLNALNIVGGSTFNTGYVGIGITAPASNLHVIGNMYVQSTFGSNTIQTDVYGNVNISGSLNVGNMGIYRNRIINGDMRISQRSVAGTNINAGNTVNTYMVDRSYTYQNVSTGQLQLLQNTLVNTDTPYQYGFRYSLKTTATTGISGATITINGIAQGIEGYNIADLNWGSAYGQPVSVSFWFRTNVTGNIGVSLSYTGTSPASYYTVYFSAIGSSTWQYITLSNIPAPPTGTAANTTNTAALTINIGSFTNQTVSSTVGWNTSAAYSSSSTNWAGITTNFIEVTGLQLEKGTIATSFEFRPFPIELEMCQRYYETSIDMGYVAGTPSVTTGTGAMYYTTVFGISSLSYGMVFFKVPKRAITTGNVSTYAPTGSTSPVCTFYVGATSTAAQTVVISSASTTGFNFTIASANTGVAVMSWVASCDF